MLSPSTAPEAILAFVTALSANEPASTAPVAILSFFTAAAAIACSSTAPCFR